MFIAKIALDFGDLGARDGIVLGVVGKDEGGYIATIKKVNVDMDGKILDVTKLLTPSALEYVEQSLIHKHIVAESRNELIRHDWERDPA